MENYMNAWVEENISIPAGDPPAPPSGTRLSSLLGLPQTKLDVFPNKLEKETKAHYPMFFIQFRWVIWWQLQGEVTILWNLSWEESTLMCAIGHRERRFLQKTCSCVEFAVWILLTRHQDWTEEEKLASKDAATVQSFNQPTQFFTMLLDVQDVTLF